MTHARTLGFSAIGRGARLLLTDRRALWLGLVPLAVILGLAQWRLFHDATPRLPLLFNVTPSLPYRIALALPTPRTLARGDFVVYRFSGSAAATLPGLLGQPFFKQIIGLPGDAIDVRGRNVYVNGVYAGFAKTHTFDRAPLTPISAGTIPADCYYVRGTNPDSFDSRYASSGLVPRSAIVHRVMPLL